MDLLFAWLPSIISGAALIISCLREPRQFRNALFLLVFVIWTAFMLLVAYGQEWPVIPLTLVAVFFPVVTAIALVANGIVVVRKNGLSAASLLPIALALFLIAMYVAFPLALVFHAPRLVILLVGLFLLEGTWFSFSLVALLLYSWLYRALPRRRTYDFIVIHGAGLYGTEPSPLLAGRIDKAFELWERQGRTGRFVASGGQGADEEISEAAAMHAYLVRKGVPDDAIIDEDRSTTTWENLRFSHELMDQAWAADGAGSSVSAGSSAGSGVSAGGAGAHAAGRTGGRAGAHMAGRTSGHAAGDPYRIAVVTSDYHVFRCAEYAHKLGIKADGVGSHTRGWYWPAAFIREFAAVTKAHLGPYKLILVLWAIPVVLLWVVPLVVRMVAQ